jgi:hypothetical protein
VAAAPHPERNDPEWGENVGKHFERREAEVGSYNTTLGLVNLSGKDIESTAVTIDHTSDWDNDKWRPDVNFTGALADSHSRNVRAEINSSTNDGCWFCVAITFTGGTKLTFRANQWDAKDYGNDGLRQMYTTDVVFDPPNPYLEVYQVVGEDSVVYCNTYYIRAPVPPDHSSWMGGLLAVSPDITLNQLTMPGSHDAGMYRSANPSSAKTQSLDVTGQLAAGSRYFDLRLGGWNVTGIEIWTYHFAYYGGRLDDILDQVRDFIVAHPTETIFLKCRSFNSYDQQPTVDLLHSKLAGHLFIANSTPNFASTRLDSLSGKVVCVLHPDYASSMIDPATGTFPYADYGVEGKGGGFIQHSSNANFGVFDSYTNANDVDEMVPDQQSKRTLYGGYGDDYLFLLSWTLTGYGSIFNLDLLSSTANGQLPQGLYDPNHPQIPNIVYIDNVDGWLCRAILSLNPSI